MNNEKWYLVKCKFQNCEAVVFNDIKACEKFASKRGIAYQEFNTRKKAIEFAGVDKRKIKFQLVKHYKQRVCLLCEKPFHGKTKLCPVCNKKRKNISVGTILAIKKAYPLDDPFVLLEKNPWILYKVWQTTNKQQRAEIRKDKTRLVSSEAYLHTKYKKENEAIPDYLVHLFEKDETKELLYLEGERLNPKVYFLCKRCGKEICQRYESLRLGKGHLCDAVRSSGETVVEEFLKQRHIYYKTQHNTIKCINPKTQRVMPYDFELPKYRIIIEVQGDQHKTFSPYFHGTEENFEYQLWKDEYKRNFAEQNGYRVLYIDYSDIHTRRYKVMIDGAIHLKR